MKLLTLFLLTSVFSSAANITDDSNDLFVVVTSSDAETQMMSMVLATQSANQDVDIRILLCSEGGKLAIEGEQFPAFQPADRSPQQLLRGLIDHGATVEVCAIFLPNRDYNEADLIEGVGIANPRDVAEYMKGDGVRYFTF